LPYLEAVVRETLRFHPPIEFTARVAECDDMIPVSEPFEGADGVMRDHIQYAISRDDSEKDSVSNNETGLRKETSSCFPLP
jgi:hypothetical protein